MYKRMLENLKRRCLVNAASAAQHSRSRQGFNNFSTVSVEKPVENVPFGVTSF